MSKKDSLSLGIEEEIVAVEEVSGELSAKEIAEIQEKARKEVAAEMKASKKKALLDSEKAKAKRSAMFSQGKDDSGEDLDEVALDLASYPKYIMLDGAVYHSGHTYKKRRAVIQVLKEIMARGWIAEAARLGESNDNFSQRRKVLGNGGLRFA